MIDSQNTVQQGTDTSFQASGIFNLTDRLQIFSYLVYSNRVRWYRVIMRLFLQTHRELYRYQLTAQEVRDAVRDAFDPDYTLEQCQNDLAALKEWGNIDTLYDTSVCWHLMRRLIKLALPIHSVSWSFLSHRASNGL